MREDLLRTDAVDCRRKRARLAFRGHQLRESSMDEEQLVPVQALEIVAATDTSLLESPVGGGRVAISVSTLLRRGVLSHDGPGRVVAAAPQSG